MEREAACSGLLASCCCERGIGGENGLQYPQNGIDAVDIVTPAINNDSVMFKLQKLPVFSCCYTAKDRFKAVYLASPPDPDTLAEQAYFRALKQSPHLMKCCRRGPQQQRAQH